MTDPLTAAQNTIRELANRKVRPLSWLEATFNVVDALDPAVAAQVMGQLLRQRYLAIYDADLAQMLAQRLGVEVAWSHHEFTGEDTWKEGRG